MLHAFRFVRTFTLLEAIKLRMAIRYYIFGMSFCPGGLYVRGHYVQGEFCPFPIECMSSTTRLYFFKKAGPPFTGMMT